MASDAHAHPYYLYKEDSSAEDERVQLNIRCAASSFDKDEFIYNEALSKKNLSPFMALCFAIHPQLPAHGNDIDGGLLFLETLALEKRIHAVGEAGFDLFNSDFKATEKVQEKIFNHHLDVALQYNVPIVLHIRRAMHKIFLYTKELKRLPAVVFHSYSGSLDEAASVLKRGINGYFSFGGAVLMNHKNAMCCAARLPAEKLLFETDAPYQPVYPKKYSCHSDVFTVIRCAAKLRETAGGFLNSTGENTAVELEKISDDNFNTIFGGKV
jgi:TatD DNase family protein